MSPEMSVALVQTYAVTAAAMITAAAATYTANAARKVLDQVGENDERSRMNRRLLTGETVDGEDVHYDGLLERVDDVEERQRRRST
ncbi:hypothetical protein ACM16X_04990 [Haloarcula japonica]|uniref:hypothetical protein n=1 Tax=Haloarcula japonica TaxID=29282 RepID=UPI0039F6B19E